MNLNFYTVTLNESRMQIFHRFKKYEWFWHSIQIEARAGERAYRPENWEPEDLTSLSENTSASDLQKSRSFDRTLSPTSILDEVVNTSVVTGTCPLIFRYLVEWKRF